MHYYRHIFNLFTKHISNQVSNDQFPNHISYHHTNINITKLNYAYEWPRFELNWEICTCHTTFTNLSNNYAM